MTERAIRLLGSRVGLHGSREAIERLFGRILTNGEAYRILRDLTEGYPSRLTGSRAGPRHALGEP